MIYGKTISIIIPCKNEEAALYSMLKSVPDYIDEVIVVDNGSTDNTTTVAKDAGAIVIREKRHINGVGYGYAHQKGLKKATGDIIVALDGDETYPMEAIKEVVRYMERSKSDFVSCARFPLADPHAISTIRQFGVQILNTQVSFLYGYQIKDILSGMWAMKREIIPLLNATNGEWNFSPEIKLAALTHPKIHFSEYHIAHKVRVNGFSKQNIWKTGFNHLRYILHRRLIVDKVSSKQQVGYIMNSVGYSLKAIVFMLLLKIR